MTTELDIYRADLIDSRTLAEVDPEDRPETEQPWIEALKQELADYWDEVQLRDGLTLIHDRYFTEYARELAKDIGAIERKANWPLNHIDWKAAADELKHDYTEVDVEVDGIEDTYWALTN